jgi:multicomponent Na+:H+ antiporter subunit E
MLVLFFVLWVILNGRITLEIVLFGIAVTMLVYIFLIKVLGYSVSMDVRITRNIPICILYIFNLILEVIKASIAVIRLALTPGAHPDPVLVEFHSGLSENFLNVLLANSITLTPGTITVFRKGDHFVIHALRREYAEGLGDSSFVKLLRRFV